MRLDLYATYRNELQPMAGLLDILPRLGVPFCVASSSQMDRIKTSLRITGLIERFDPGIFSATLVEHGKPAPDLFLHAAREMGVAPEHCLVIEDSPAGIIAAKKAGMRVFAFTGGGHIGPSGLAEQIEALHPDASFADMNDLPALLERERGRTGGAMRNLLVAVDVGTGSARAGVVSATGVLLGRAEQPIAMRRTDANHAEHDSAQIWDAAAAAVRAAMAAAGAEPADVVGLSFDATCSLVVRDRDGAPLPVGDGDARWDTIVWLDHRSLEEAAECTASGHPRSGVHWRRHVARNGNPQADVAEAPQARHLGPRRLFFRSRRFPHLEGLGLDRSLAMHPHLQMDLDRSTRRLAARFPRHRRSRRHARARRPARSGQPHRHRSRSTDS